MEAFEILKKLNSLVIGGKKKSQIETEVGLPKNSLSNFLSGNKALPKKWIEPLSQYCESKTLKPKPILLDEYINNQQEDEDARNSTEEIEDLKLENQKLRTKLLEAQGEIAKLTKQLAEKTKTGATNVQNLTTEPKKSNFTINTKKDNYDPFKNPLFNSKNKTKTTD